MLNNTTCQICGGIAKPLDVVDFNKSCEERRGLFLRLSGIAVYYFYVQSVRLLFRSGIQKVGVCRFFQVYIQPRLCPRRSRLY